MSLSSLLFPDIKPLELIIKEYANRPADKIVTRIAPSPTGFLHIGTVYTGLINEKYAHQSNGTFILRIEDTDQARNTTDFENKTWGIYSIVEWLNFFKLQYDEGMKVDQNRDIYSDGDFGPYQQSLRLDIYKSFVAYLLDTKQAYVCFLSWEELENMRTAQQVSKSATWVYGNYAIYRNLSDDQVKEKLLTNNSWRTIRRKATANPWDKISFNDGIKWSIEMEANYIDQVILKSDWFPSYALAHIVDDYLMGTTHVIRADEWLASVPYHIQLFSGFKDILTRKQWSYNHNSPILKLDNWNRRKLSKRKDPEADVNVLIKQWYPAEAIKIYLMSLINSKFEDRRREQNLNSENFISYHDFPINFENCNTAWAIFDLTKLNSICSDYLSMINLNELIDQLHQFYLTTAQQKILLFENEYSRENLVSILWFDRNKKLHTTYQDIIDYIEPLLADSLEIDESLFPNFINKKKRQELILLYSNWLSKYFNENETLQVSKEERREFTKEFSKEQWFALNKKEFIEWTHIWLISDFAMILRIYLYGKTQTPDIYSMISIYGKQKTSNRLLTTS